MVQYRKQKKLGPFRFTVSQRGISTSFGAGLFRISKGADGKVRRTVRIPGTGIYDTKVVSRPPRKHASGKEMNSIMPPNQHQPPVGPPSAGWYRDPGGGAFRRYWDGHQWTQATDEPPQPPPNVATTPENKPESFLRLTVALPGRPRTVALPGRPRTTKPRTATAAGVSDLFRSAGSPLPATAAGISELPRSAGSALRRGLGR